MPIYTYKVITPELSIVEGKMESFSSLWVRFRLHRKKNTVLFIKRGTNKTGSTTTKQPLYISISSIQQILFFRNLAMMLDSGISLSDALNNSASQAKGMGLPQALQNIYFEVSNGNKLSQALGRYKKLSPVYVTKTIEVGEQSGTLSDTLDRIAQDLERAYELRRKVIGAISYPLIIIFFMIVTAILLIIMVLPQIIKLFTDLNAPVPAATRALQASGEFMSTHPIEIVTVLFLVIAGFIVAMKNLHFRLTVHYLLLRLPIFGNLIREYSLSIITRSLGTLLSSGITFVQALETVKGTVKNESYIQTINKIYPLVLQGGAFSDALHISTFHFPDQLRYLVEVGEQTGQLKRSFEKASTHYERSVMFQTQMLTTVLEPILMLFAGLLVGFLAFSIFGPIYDIATHM